MEHFFFIFEIFPIVGCNSLSKNVLCKTCTTVNVGICETANYVACKGGCTVGWLFDHNCKQKCMDAIYKPCVDKLVNDCYSNCLGNLV